MTHYLIQASLQDSTGLSRDRYINTFHVEGTLGTTANLEALAGAVTSFYTEFGTIAQSIAHYLARHATETPGTIKIYNQDLPIPRTPVWQGPLLTAVPGERPVALPAEVAVCISYKGPAFAGANLARQRGRIYIGPLNMNAVSPESVTAKARPNLEMRTYFVAHFIRLMGLVEAIGDFNLRQYSPKDLAVHGIEQAWCDDAWDTQRRRGAEPSSRQTAIFV